MTVYQLMLYACLTTNLGLFSPYSKTCEWHQEGTLWATEQACTAASKRYVGQTVFGDVTYANSTHIYEDVNCIPRAVLR